MVGGAVGPVGALRADQRNTGQLPAGAYKARGYSLGKRSLPLSAAVGTLPRFVLPAVLVLAVY